MLTVLKKEVVPEFKVLQGGESLSTAAVTNILTKTVDELVQTLNWLTALTPKQGFFWGIVATFCSKIPVKVDSLVWIQDYDYVMSQLLCIYEAYCTGRGSCGDKEKHLKAELPVNLRHYDDIRMYVGQAMYRVLYIMLKLFWFVHTL